VGRVTGTFAAEQRFFEHDGQRLGLRYHGGGDRGGPVVLLLPAMGVPAGYYDPFAARLVEVGLDVLVADLRGTGVSTPRPGRASRYGYAELAGDVGAVLAGAPELAGRPVLLLGHSLGGHAAAAHLALTTGATGGLGGGPSVRGLVLVASGVPNHRLYEGRRALSVRAAGWLIPAAAAVVGYWPKVLGFGGSQARGVMRDWGRLARSGRLPELAGVDVEAALAGVTLPVLGISADAGTDHRPPVRQVHRRAGDPAPLHGGGGRPADGPLPVDPGRRAAGRPDPRLRGPRRLTAPGGMPWHPARLVDVQVSGGRW
jgi:predicted alpha/beta hydrolase